GTCTICTLSLHDALPIWGRAVRRDDLGVGLDSKNRAVTDSKRASYAGAPPVGTNHRLSRPRWLDDVPVQFGRGIDQARDSGAGLDRKSTRLNSSHGSISY